MLIAVVGEAPAKGRSEQLRLPQLPLWPSPPGCTGARLMALLGLGRAEYLSSVGRYNLLGFYPGTRWPAVAARHVAEALLAVLPGLPVVLLGRRVATAAGAGAIPYIQRHPRPCGGCLLVLPHPSGLNRWYHEEKNRRKAERALRSLIAERRVAINADPGLSLTD